MFKKLINITLLCVVVSGLLYAGKKPAKGMVKKTFNTSPLQQLVSDDISEIKLSNGTSVFVGGVILPTPEEIAEQALDKIISIGNNSHPVIQAQAEAFRTEIGNVLLAYLKQAVASHNTTLTNRFLDAGHPELVKLLEV